MFLCQYVYFEFVHLYEYDIVFCCILSISGSRPVTWYVVQAAVTAWEALEI